MIDGNLKLVIVGHIDHGKSTLIGRLLYETHSIPESKIEEIKQICENLGKEMEFAYVLDHLEEERTQGITIDTTQIFFKSKKRNYVIIDAPGHVEFIRNMITGASQAEAAILIVDVAEGVKEQTKRHAYILSLLGLKQVIVTLNKMDIVNYDKNKFEEIKTELLEFLSEIGIHPTYVIPISAKVGDFVVEPSERLKWYDGPTIVKALDSFQPMDTLIHAPMRFIVQDVYNIDKRIIVGRVESGKLKVNDRVKILLSDEETTIKSIEVFGKDTNEAEPGMSIGITTEDKVFVDRGNVIVDANSRIPTITDEVEGSIFWMDREPYRMGEVLRFRCGTQEVNCEITDIKRVIDSASLKVIGENVDRINNREAADVIIKTDKPVVVENFSEIPLLGRFVLGRMDTCAGGIVKMVK